MSVTFGTEGWRAVMGKEFTIPNVRLVAQAIAEHYRAAAGRRGPVTMAVGYDTRAHSNAFARTVSEVLAGNGIRVRLSDRTVPTCAVSRYVKDDALAAGVMITASHNPPVYNGIKVKARYGGSATTEVVAAIERRIGRSAVKRLSFEDAVNTGLIRSVELLPRFLKGITSFVDLAAVRRARLRVLVDSMHGAGDRYIERLLRGGRCRVETLRAERDPLFGALAKWRPAKLAGLAVRAFSAMDGAKVTLADESWLLFRRSGTEPIVRIYAETPTRSRLPELMRTGVRLARKG